MDNLFGPFPVSCSRTIQPKINPDWYSHTEASWRPGVHTDFGDNLLEEGEGRLQGL